MKVSILQDTLAKGLNIVKPAVSPRSTLPVLMNVLLATEDGRLRISATNLDLVISSWQEANIEIDGSITVPMRTFGDLVNALSPERVDLERPADSNKMRVTCGSNTAHIHTIPADEFPMIPEPGDNDQVLPIPAHEMRSMIRQVAFAAANDDTRPILGGVLMEYDGTTLTMAAADGFRLAIRKLELSLSFEPFSLAIPSNALKEVERISSDEEHEIRMVIPPEQRQVMFYMSNAAIVAQVLDGAFPDYGQIIPASYSTRTEMDRFEFLRACKRADIFAREVANHVEMHIQPHDSALGTVTVNATAADKGDNEGVLSAHVEGDEVEVAFNVRYFLDVLNVLEDDRIWLETVDARSPGVIRPVNGDAYIYIVMPMRSG